MVLTCIRDKRLDCPRRILVATNQPAENHLGSRGDQSVSPASVPSTPWPSSRLASGRRIAVLVRNIAFSSGRNPREPIIASWIWAWVPTLPGFRRLPLDPVGVPPQFFGAENFPWRGLTEWAQVRLLQGTVGWISKKHLTGGRAEGFLKSPFCGRHLEVHCPLKKRDMHSPFCSCRDRLVVAESLFGGCGGVD